MLATGLDSAFTFADRYGPPMGPEARLRAFDDTRELGRRFGCAMATKQAQLVALGRIARALATVPTRRRYLPVARERFEREQDAAGPPPLGPLPSNGQRPDSAAHMQ